MYRDKPDSGGQDGPLTRTGALARYYAVTTQMIVDEHKIIFIHIPKCAGESIETVFMGKPFNIPGDNYQMHPEKHLSIREIRTRYPEKFHSYLKFTVIRNPWDRVVSWVHYRDRRLNRTSGTFLERLKTDMTCLPKSNLFLRSTCYSMLTIGGRMPLDHIIRYEELQSGFNEVCEKIGIDTTPLPVVNSSRRTRYRDYYDDEARELVASHFRLDIRYFNYRY